MFSNAAFPMEFITDLKALRSVFCPIGELDGRGGVLTQTNIASAFLNSSSNFLLVN